MFHIELTINRDFIPSKLLAYIISFENQVSEIYIPIFILLCNNM